MPSDRSKPADQLSGSSYRSAVSQVVKLRQDSKLGSRDRLGAVLKWSAQDVQSGRYRMMLYRFLADHVPTINACLWTWIRLAAAPGEYSLEGDDDSAQAKAARERLKRLWRCGYADVLGNRVGLTALLPDLFSALFRDGMFGGFVTVYKDSSGVDRFLPLDPINIVRVERRNGLGLALELHNRKIDLDRADFYYIPFNNGVAEPFGRSILQAIPFVSYIEQQLVDDMRRASHNSGFHRLHVKISPPERLAGESDNAYTERINSYFDSTVKMIKSCDVDDNPVTWDNVLIEYVGPDKSREVTNSWFMNHRAMIEDICAGTNLAPYLLGYSYGATATWSHFKFDVVMRQIRSIQTEVAHFLEWLGNIDLALAGLKLRCRFVFDNTLAYQAVDRLAVTSGRIDNVLKLYKAGLIDEAAARERAWDLL